MKDERILKSSAWRAGEGHKKKRKPQDYPNEWGVGEFTREYALSRD